MEFRAQMVVAFACLFAGSSLTAAPWSQRPGGWPCGGTIDPSYVEVAEATGGKVMLFTPSELAGSVADMSASREHQEIVFRAAGDLARGEYEFDVPVDSTIESAYFFVSVQCLEGVSIVRASGGELQAEQPGVERHHFTAVRLYTVRAPDPGRWKVRVAGRGFFSVIVQAKTALSLAGVAFLEGDVALDQPRAGLPQRLEARVTGETEEVSFQTVSLDASPIELIDLSLQNEDESGRTYAGEVTPADGSFRVSVTGRDTNGFRFQRVSPRLLTAR